jgi:hypothetical protein
MYFLLVFLITQAECKVPLSLAEVTARGVISAASQGSVLLIDLVSSGGTPMAELALFDFAKQKVCMVEDGRLPMSLNRVVMADGNGRFLIADPTDERFIWLSKRGKWLEDLRFDGFQNYPGGRIVTMVPYPPGRVVLNFREPEGDRLILGYFDLSAKTFDWLHALDHAFNKSHFVPSGGKWFLVVPETGELTSYDGQFRKMQTLHEPRDPVLLLDDSMKQVREMLARKGGGIHYAYLAGPRFLGNRFAYRFRLPAERKKGLVLSRKDDQRVFLLTEGQLSENPSRDVWLVSRYQGKALVFDEDAWTFSIR